MATNALSRVSLVLEDSRLLRQLTVVLFYLTQGFPLGLFYYAIPAWMASAGASTGQIATVVATAQLPWSLKLINGFIIDRYAYLPMGRRRAWIIGAQTLLVSTLLVAALANPGPTDLAMLAAIGFAASIATTFQDVAIDSMVVDIMPEDERTRASGFMLGAQVIGMSVATALGGLLFAQFGFAAALAVLAVVPLAVLVFGIVIRERNGERRMPWSVGEAHPASRAIQVEAWWPLLRSAFRALFAPMSLMLLPILIVRSLPWGGFDAFHPVLFTQTLGWPMESWTGFYSTVLLVGGIAALFIGGPAVGWLGLQRALLIASLSGAVALVAMGLARQYWAEPGVAVGFVLFIETCGMIYFVAGIPLAMRLCTPAIAATQFTVYMAVANFGRPIGAAIAGVTVGQGNPHWFYFAAAASWVLAAAILLLARFPREVAGEQAAAEALPQGEGLAPRVN